MIKLIQNKNKPDKNLINLKAHEKKGNFTGYCRSTRKIRYLGKYTLCLANNVYRKPPPPVAFTLENASFFIIVKQKRILLTSKRLTNFERIRISHTHKFIGQVSGLL